MESSLRMRLDGVSAMYNEYSERELFNYLNNEIGGGIKSVELNEHTFALINLETAVAGNMLIRKLQRTEYFGRQLYFRRIPDKTSMTRWKKPSNKGKQGGTGDDMEPSVNQLTKKTWYSGWSSNAKPGGVTYKTYPTLSIKPRFFAKQFTTDGRDSNIEMFLRFVKDKLAKEGPMRIDSSFMREKIGEVIPKDAYELEPLDLYFRAFPNQFYCRGPYVCIPEQSKKADDIAADDDVKLSMWERSREWFGGTPLTDIDTLDHLFSVLVVLARNLYKILVKDPRVRALFQYCLSAEFFKELGLKMERFNDDDFFIPDVEKIVIKYGRKYRLAVFESKLFLPDEQKVPVADEKYLWDFCGDWMDRKWKDGWVEKMWSWDQYGLVEGIKEPIVDVDDNDNNNNKAAHYSRYDNDDYVSVFDRLPPEKNTVKLAADAVAAAAAEEMDQNRINQQRAYELQQLLLQEKKAQEEKEEKKFVDKYALKVDVVGEIKGVGGGSCKSIWANAMRGAAANNGDVAGAAATSSNCAPTPMMLNDLSMPPVVNYSNLRGGQPAAAAALKQVVAEVKQDTRQSVSTTTATSASRGCFGGQGRGFSGASSRNGVGGMPPPMSSVQVGCGRAKVPREQQY